MTIKEIDRMCFETRNNIQTEIDLIWARYELSQEAKKSIRLFREMGIFIACQNYIGIHDVQ